jgi:outer membrane murein-binding lipoprotein Lpp
MSFKDLIRNAIFEEEPQSAHPAQPAAPAARPSRPIAAAMPTATASVPVSAGSTTPGRDIGRENTGGADTGRDNEFYGRLLKQTDFSAVPDLAKIETYAAPLADVIPDKSLRYKAAMATAKSQSGLTKASIMKGFDDLMATLESASTSFSRQTDEISKNEIDGKGGQIADLNASIEQKQKEIADMQQQVKAMQTQADTSRARLQQARATFQSAYQRRKSEIEQQRKEFETLLQ